ncbi:MAG: acyltransferase [Pseudomonadales bacterium]|nr:acyltransferase [Pseudomonadales bacterium]
MGKTEFHAIQEKLKGRIEGLDALRGIAVIWVVWHNCTDEFELAGILEKILAFLTNNGWLGVQLFFVLSGFLITGLLLDAKGSKHQYRNFYLRRTLRIFPLYYATLIFLFFLLPLFSIDYEELTKSQDSQIWFWLYLNNWTGMFAPVGMLTHFWSLAVEEQFYLFWPCLVLGLSRNNLMYSCIAFILSAVVFRIVITYFFPFLYDHDATYTFTIARWDSLALGALLAIAMRNRQWLQHMMNYRRTLTITLVGSSIAIVLYTHNFSPTGSGITVLNQTLAAAIFVMLLSYTVIPSNTSTVWLNRFLMGKFLNTVGKYSYAIYIFHGVLKHLWRSTFVIDTSEHLGLQLWLVNLYNVTIIFAASMLLAMISWRVLERPFLRLKRYAR